MTGRKLYLVAALLWMIAACLPQMARADDDIPALVENLKKIATSDAGTDEQDKIVHQLQSHGAAAIPYLLPLLKDKTETIRNMASSTLNGIDGLTEKDLPALIDSFHSGNEAIPPAIARIGTPGVVSFLVEEMVRERKPDTQLDYAVVDLGEKAVPLLVQIYEDKNEGWDTDLEKTLRGVLSYMREKAAGVVDPLAKIARNKSNSRKKRVRAIYALGATKLLAEKESPMLEELRKHDPDKWVRGYASFSIQEIGAKEAVPLLLARMQGMNFGPMVGWIAEMGERGKAAGPVLRKYLSNQVEDKDWDKRLAVIWLMGCINYQEANDDLISLLENREDWRVVMSAAESLARMREERALPKLDWLSRNYWYPPVRKAAALAIEIIQEKKRGLPAKTGKDFPEESFSLDQRDYEGGNLSYEDMDSIKLPVIKPIKPWTVDHEEVFLVPVRLVRQSSILGKLRGVSVEGGCIVGDDRGEWGGETTFFGTKGSQIIIQENTDAIYKTPIGIVAVTGLAHLSYNEGLVYKIHKAGNGKWVAKKWRELPAAPGFTCMLKDGRLLVSCMQIVAISPVGKMELLTKDEVIGKQNTP